MDANNTLRHAASAFALAVLMLGSLACPGRAQEDGALSAEQAAAWRADLAYLAAELPKRHVDLFAKLSADEFQAAVAKLDADIPSLQQHEVVVRLEQLVALVGDGHTSLNQPQQPPDIYPVVVWWFADGPYVIQTTREHEQLMGKQLLAVNGVPVAQVEQLVGSTFAWENRSQLLQYLPMRLMHASTLDALGLAPSLAETTVTVADGSGGEITEAVQATVFDRSADWTMAGPGIPGLTVPRGPNYRYLWNPATGVLDLEYNACVQRDDLPFDRFAEDFLKALADNPWQRVVIDLRNNGGGDSSIMDPLIKKLAAMPEVNQRGKLYVLIGRATFSSAALNAMSLRNTTQAILVGEPSGGKPNHFGEVKTFTLPNSGLIVQYSTKHFETTAGDPDSIYPDIEALQTYADYLDSHDPVLAVAAEGVLPSAPVQPVG